MHNPFVSVIIAAAGNSSRMGADVSKQLITISDKAVIEYSLMAFSKSDFVREIIIAAKSTEIDVISEYKRLYPKITSVIAGGNTRQESVANALSCLSDKSDILAIHDAARPLITTMDIDRLINEAVTKEAVCPVSRVVDTVKIGKNGVISGTLDRNTLFLASTPQVFSTKLYREAFRAATDVSVFTDDCLLIESFGKKVHLYIMENDNTKITTSKDLETIKSKLTKQTFRVGHGYDVHRLVDGRKLILGGVDIPHTTGLLGHSDADVLVHAIMDSLLGAAALGDIGVHFPDTCEKYKGISSILLLEHVGSLLKENGYEINNIDATVVAQAPKLSPFIAQMKTNIANALSINECCVNIKATTEEHLGFTGEKLGISAHSVCSLIGLQTI